MWQNCKAWKNRENQNSLVISHQYHLQCFFFPSLPLPFSPIQKPTLHNNKITLPFLGSNLKQRQATEKIRTQGVSMWTRRSRKSHPFMLTQKRKRWQKDPTVTRNAKEIYLFLRNTEIHHSNNNKCWNIWCMIHIQKTDTLAHTKEWDWKIYIVMCSGKLYNRLNITLAEKTRRLKLETKRISTSRGTTGHRLDQTRGVNNLSSKKKNKHDKPTTQHRNLNGFIYAASMLFLQTSQFVKNK